MQKVIIATDSTSDLLPETIRQLGVVVVPLHVIIDMKDYRCGVDIDSQEFFRILPESFRATTSQPNKEEIKAVWLEAVKNQKEKKLISFHLSRELSRTYESAVEASHEVSNEIKVKVFDSRTVSFGLGLIVEEAAEMAKKGLDMEEIEKNVKQLIPGIKIWAAFDTLKYLERGGRIGKAKCWAGTLLRTKPILGVVEGAMVPISKVSGRKNIKNELLKLLDTEILSSKKTIQKIGLAYHGVISEVEELVEELKIRYPGIPIKVALIGPTVGVHSGPNILGLGGIFK